MKKIEDDIAELKVSRQRRWQLRRVRAGKCMICGGELANASHCEPHRLAHASQQRARYARERALAQAGV